MTDKEATQEQVKQFAQWCGFTDIRVFAGRPGWDGVSPSGEFKVIELGLDSLFKYAVLKLNTAWALRITKLVDTPFFLVELTYATLRYGEVKMINEDPALALFWAIYSLIDKSPPNVV